MGKFSALRKWVRCGVVLVAALVSTSILAGEALRHDGSMRFDGRVWRRVRVIDEVAISVHVVSPDEILRIRDSFIEKAPPCQYKRTNILKCSTSGFSVLRRIDGKYTCDIYVTFEQDGDTIRHEEKHCYGWNHRE